MKKNILLACVMVVFALTGCSNSKDTIQEDSKKQTEEEVITNTVEHVREYVHGDTGYFSLIDKGYGTPVKMQESGTETYYKFVDDDNFDLNIVSNATGSNITYEIAAEDIAAGIATTTQAGTVDINTVGMVHIVAKGSAAGHYSEASKVITVIISDKPVVTTGSANTSVSGLSATLQGTVKKGTETGETNGFVEWGFMYKKASDTDYTKLLVPNSASDTLTYELAGLELNTEYNYYTYITTRTGTIKSNEEVFTLSDDKVVETIGTENVNYNAVDLIGNVQSGTVTEKGFEYRVKGNKTYLRVSVPVASNTRATIDGLYPGTIYEYRTYAVSNGIIMYGNVAEVTTLTYSPIPDTTMKVVDTLTREEYTADLDNSSRYLAVVDYASTGITVTSGGVGVTGFTYNDIAYTDDTILPDDSTNQITDDGLGNVSIGSNIKQVKVTYEIDGTGYTVICVRGSFEVEAKNNSNTVIANLDQEYLKNSVDQTMIENYVTNGDKVLLSLRVADFAGSGETKAKIEDFVKINMHEKARISLFDMSVLQIINDSEETATKIPELERPIKVRLTLSYSWENVRDVRVVHEDHDGNAEFISVVRQGNDIEFYAKDFSTYALATVNEFNVSYNIEGQGTVTPDNELTLLEGDKVGFAITPARLYHIESVSDNGVTVDINDFKYSISNVNCMYDNCCTSL